MISSCTVETQVASHPPDAPVLTILGPNLPAQHVDSTIMQLASPLRCLKACRISL